MVFEVKKDYHEIENKYKFGNNQSLSRYAIEENGSIHPLVLPSFETNGTGLMNPSIINLNGNILVNIRHVNYTFYHSEMKTFQHQWGPLTYLHPENDHHLRTTNFLCLLDDNLNICRHFKVDTSEFDTYEPMWDFVGLEDARLVDWEGSLYLTGVRRDTTVNGQGRMELSKLSLGEDFVKETSRFRIPPPIDMSSYCEKNWMPVLDKPFTYMKWSNPPEVVRVDPDNRISMQEIKGAYVNAPNDFRGGSQLIPWYDNTYIAIVHEVDLFQSTAGRKDAVYRHRFVLWDANTFAIKKFTNDFSMMNGHVEFAVGMCYKDDDVLITFGFQDNAAYLLKMPKESLRRFVNDN